MQSAFLYSWCCSFAQAALYTQCYYCRSISVFAFTYLAAYMSSNALQPVDGDSAPLGLCALVQVRSRLLAAMHRPLRMRPMQMLLTPSLMTLWVSYCNMSSIVHDREATPLSNFARSSTLYKSFSLWKPKETTESLAVLFSSRMKLLQFNEALSFRIESTSRLLIISSKIPRVFSYFTAAAPAVTLFKIEL